MTDFLIAECAIRQLQARYTDAVWRKDFDAFGDCFAEDCEWRISGLILHGRAEIVGTFSNLMSRFRRVLVTLRTPILDVGDGVASGRTYLSEQNAFVAHRPYTPLGIYYERFVDQGDRWRFAWRLFQTHYTGGPDIAGPLFENPEYGPPPGMPGLNETTVNHAQYNAVTAEL